MVNGTGPNFVVGYDDGRRGLVLGTFSPCFGVFSVLFLRVAVAFEVGGIERRAPKQIGINRPAFLPHVVLVAPGKLDLARPVVKLGVGRWSLRV